MEYHLVSLMLEYHPRSGWTYDPTSVSILLSLCHSSSQESQPHWCWFSFQSYSSQILSDFRWFEKVRRAHSGCSLFSKEPLYIFWPFGSFRIQTDLVNKFCDGRKWHRVLGGLTDPSHRWCSLLSLLLALFSPFFGLVLFFGHMCIPPLFPFVVLCFETGFHEIGWSWTCYLSRVMAPPAFISQVMALQM